MCKPAPTTSTVLEKAEAIDNSNTTEYDHDDHYDDHDNDDDDHCNNNDQHCMNVLMSGDVMMIIIIIKIITRLCSKGLSHLNPIDHISSFIIITKIKYSL